MLRNPMRFSAFITGLLILFPFGSSCDERREEDIQRISAELQQQPEDSPGFPVWLESTLFAPTEALSERKDAAGAFWLRFRSAYPYGLQGIALSDPGEDGRYAVIVAEPPPHVTATMLIEQLEDASVQKWDVGYDGALFDVVGYLSGDEAEIVRKLEVLNLLLFRTSYGAFVYTEPFSTRWKDARGSVLDVSPTPTELMSWLTHADAAFIPIEGGPAEADRDVMASHVSKVYRLKDTHLIVWWIPEDESISDCLVQAREFALESDIIVGAIGKEGLWVCGRERIAPYDVLPPLRVESIALLAALSDRDELAQSYQRNHPGAGTYDATYDWAPILLSEELVDTEFGHLLNVADQLLKGWSQAGTVKYVNFDYDPPTAYPFGRNVPLSEIVSREFEQGSVTFNWNTTGAGCEVRIDGLPVVTPFRTGALPISYIPGEDPLLAPQMTQYEDTAYDWYAGLSDSTLARVVQYSTLYQIFHHLGVGSPDQAAPSSDAPYTACSRIMGEFWEHVTAMEEDDLEPLVESPVMKKHLPVDEQVNLFMLLLESTVMELPEAKRAEFQQLLDADRGQLEAEARLMFESNPTEFIRVILMAGLEALQALEGEDRESLKQAMLELEGAYLTEEAQFASELGNLLLSSAASVNKLPEQYSAAVPVSGRSWIHTPSLVFSSAGSVGAVGGHSIRASITGFEPTDAVAQGTVRIVGGKVQINKADLTRAPVIQREAARGLQAGEPVDTLESRLIKLLASTSEPPQRTPGAALGLNGQQLETARPTTGVDFLTSRVDVPAELRDPAHVGGIEDGRVRVTKIDNTFWVSGPSGQGPVPASNLRDAGQLAGLRARSYSWSGGGRWLRPGRYSSRKSAAFEFVDCSEQEVHACRKNIEESLSSREHPAELVVSAFGKKGRVPRLDPLSYDFANPLIEVHKVEVLNGRTTSRISIVFEGKAKATGSAEVDMLLSARDKQAEAHLPVLAEAGRRHALEVCAAAADGSLPDPLELLHGELKRVANDYGVDLETEVRTQQQNWKLVREGRVADAA